MSSGQEEEIDPWYYTTWEGQESEKLARSLAATYEERFTWLCEAFDFFASLHDRDHSSSA